MRHQSRRKWDVFWLGVVSVVLGAGATVAAMAGDTERISSYWTSAVIGPDDTADIVEVIDYDFGPRQRRGIFRDVPGLPETATVEVTATDAPDDVTLLDRGSETRIRIGDPDITVTDRHRYTIRYRLDTLVAGVHPDDDDPFEESRALLDEETDAAPAAPMPPRYVAWNAVAADWEVPIEAAEIHVVDRFELTDLECNQGRFSARGGCTVTQIEPGHLVVTTSDLDSRNGVTIVARRQAPLAEAPAVPDAPAGEPDDDGSGWWLPGIVALVASILPMVGISRLVRHAGREEVYAGGAADAAFGPPAGETLPVVTMDADELAQLATIEFEAPRDLSATAGGIILRERVETRHQMAWLIECAIREEIEIEGEGKDMHLRRGAATPHPTVAPTLDAMFDGRSEIELGKYDETFSEAWKGLSSELDEWWKHSGLWQPDGHRRRRQAIGYGFLATLVGVALMALGGVMAARSDSAWLGMVFVGAAFGGGGLAAMLRSWELPVRSAEGSSRWLQVESFRRFIANSEVRHAEAAARMGLLRQYTAWAVALDELDHWNDAVQAAAIDPAVRSSMSAGDIAFVSMAPSLSRATASTFTAPSSSGGGGGGGGVGGGGGGGGGGSW